MSSFVGETLQKAVDAAKNVFSKPPTILLVLLPDTGAWGPRLSVAAVMDIGRYNACLATWAPCSVLDHYIWSRIQADRLRFG